MTFAHAASHDLQAPAHKIAAFGELLRRRLDGRVDPQSLDYLERMIRAAGTLRGLVDDLLSLTRVTTRGGPPVQTDATAAAREALAEIAARRGPLPARVDIGRLPPVHADPAQLRKLFAVLLDNAVKFRRPGVPWLATVSGRELDGLCEYVVADSGKGFDERRLDPAFPPFQRLHDAAEGAGSGMGLAIAARIIARHGGSLTAHSVPGTGSTFVARLPRDPIAAPS